MSAEGRSAGWEYSHDPTFDRWLRFDPDTEAVYEAERGGVRIRHLKKMILLGLLFYNLYNFSGYYLMPDIFWPSVIMRVFGVTTFSLVILYLVPRVSSTIRERMMMAACV
jgi:hypothetical protein